MGGEMSEKSYTVQVIEADKKDFEKKVAKLLADGFKIEGFIVSRPVGLYLYTALMVKENA